MARIEIGWTNETYTHYSVFFKAQKHCYACNRPIQERIKLFLSWLVLRWALGSARVVKEGDGFQVVTNSKVEEETQ